LQRHEVQSPSLKHDSPGPKVPVHVVVPELELEPEPELPLLESHVQVPIETGMNPHSVVQLMSRHADAEVATASIGPQNVG
jgi:hypothetical protein